MREAFRIALLFGVLLALAIPAAVAQRVVGQQPSGGRINPGLGRQGNRLPNQRKLDRPPFGGPQLGRRPGALPRNQEQKRLLQQRLMQAIGLTPDQHARMQEIRRGHDDEVIAAGRRLRQARRSLDLAIMSERYDEATVRRATDELATSQADRIKLDSKIRAEVRGVLTPDQVVRFHQLERQMRQEMKQQNLQERETQEPTTPPTSRPPLGTDETDPLDLLSSANENR
jgi:Spy/CpxP family protein refolding chaperone